MFVVIYEDAEGQVCAGKTVYASEAEAGASATLRMTLGAKRAWVMQFPDPREVAND